ncbi:unnamed protein product [Pleuronectes platessa]|uniref:Retinoblastoma binding protein 6 n=1 Tax=Pleuronectes platessa TaxID=8262 RepID=A0A9N7VMX6_PLEPL|nr:unnamed protein product [Pleuronectes platessa]
MRLERLKARHCELQISDAQTNEEYTDDEAEIPRLSSVIVRRIPPGGVKPAGKTFIVHLNSKAAVRSPKPILQQKDSSISASLAKLAKTGNLVDANASEDDKIEAMKLQSNYEYASINYSKNPYGPLPDNYICYRCGKPGHHIRQCPSMFDESVEAPKRFRKCTGIPQSFMVKAEPGTKGAMLNSDGEYAIPVIDAEAYARGKKERPPFVPHDDSSPEEEANPIPSELLCPICKDLLTDAVVIPCCGNSYCDDCIRTFLLDSEEHICFTCQQSDVSPDSLIANNFLRQVVNNHKNQTPNTKLILKQVPKAARPSPRLQMSRPLRSTQLDPLRANVTHPPPAIILTAAPQTQVQPPAPSPPAPVTDQHSPMQSTNQGDPPSPGEFDPEPTVRQSPESDPEIGPHGSHVSVLGLPSPIRPPHPSVYTAPPPPVYPSPYLYPPPAQLYPPPYNPGFPPPPFGYSPQPMHAPGPRGLTPPWIPPGVRPPLPHLGPRFSQPPPSKKYCNRRGHRQHKTTPDEFPMDFHEELMEYKNSPKGQRPSYSSRSPFGGSQSRARSRSRSNGRSYPRSPYSRHNGRSYRRSRSRSHSPLLSPPPLLAGPREGAEGPATFRSRSRSPGGFRSRSPGGQQPPPRGPPPYELKGPSPGGHDRRERKRRLQLEKEDTDRYKKHRNDYDNQHPSLHHRGRGSSDGDHQPPSSSSSGTKSSTKVLKTKKATKKRPREEPEPSQPLKQDRIQDPIPQKEKSKKLYSEASPASDPSTVLPDPCLPSLLPLVTQRGKKSKHLLCPYTVLPDPYLPSLLPLVTQRGKKSKHLLSLKQDRIQDPIPQKGKSKKLYSEASPASDPYTVLPDPYLPSLLPLVPQRGKTSKPSISQKAPTLSSQTLTYPHCSLSCPSGERRANPSVERSK